jgi:diguanylate cyclase (GGDEF)-like protein
MIDLDNLKGINDRYGHKAGDEALVYTVKILRQALRSADFIARYAGDEFVVVFATSEENDLTLLENRILQEVQSVNSCDLCPFPISFSMGFGVYDPQIDASPDAFIKRIDKTMYEIKRRRKEAEAERQSMTVS